MPKVLLSGMQTHLGQAVTSLAACWKVVRTDGVEFYFTNHDRDLLFNANIYEAETGYASTAIKSDTSMAVDNLDVEGILDSAAIDSDELRQGFFDFATVEIFLVNWVQPDTDGPIKLRRGRLGQVTTKQSGVFIAEIRGLAQQLTQTVVEQYTPDCRASLGDSKCKVPIEPPLHIGNTAYALGDFVRVATTGGTGQEVYENRIYEVTTAGTSDGTPPTFDTVVGNTTVDNTVTWTAREAWTRHAVVATVASAISFTLTVTEARDVDDWFNLGVINWDTGNNIPKPGDVKDWDQGTATITLFLPMPQTIQVGDKLSIFPGCDKRLSICSDKFSNVINMRAEPYVMGTDELFAYPDAR